MAIYSGLDPCFRASSSANFVLPEDAPPIINVVMRIASLKYTMASLVESMTVYVPKSMAYRLVNINSGL